MSLCMFMNKNQRAIQALRIEQARQMQEIRTKYPVLGDSMDWLAKKIAGVDLQWHTLAINNDALQQLRGQKQALLDVKNHFASMLEMNIAEQAAKLNEGDGDDGA